MSSKDDNDKPIQFHYKDYPKVAAEVWSNIHSLPIRRFVCPSCDKSMYTSVPFVLKESVESPNSWVGLTTEGNGIHDCGPENNISVGRLIVDSTSESMISVIAKRVLKKLK